MKDGFATTLGLAAGIGIPVMAALNAGLGVRMGSPFAAAAILCTVAFAACVGALAMTGGFSGNVRFPPPNTGYLAGFLFTLYIVSITWLAPRIGVGNAVFLVLLGQLISSAVIDHFGLFGAPRVPIDTQRAAGLALMAIGVFLARRPV